jgi:two-component system sensor histidine kinase/response regulator
MKKILVIEDEKILREEVIEWLTLEDYEAVGAEGGMAGIETTFRFLPDLIICDITMPRLDGHGVLLELRSNLATADIPFIFMTARASYEDIRTGMDMGADDYITKPFSRMELLQAVQTRLEKKGIQQEQQQQKIEQWQEAFQQEHEQVQLKARLVAMFSHDFRNPLASIMSCNSLMMKYADRLDENQRLKHMNRIDASVRQLVQMLDDMLVVSQMETGNLDFKPEPLNIEDFLRKIVEEFQTIYDETYPLVFESQFNDTIMADSRLLRQIATNLISNAIKYSPQGSVVDILLKHHDGQFLLSVRDYGIGIPEVEQASLFNAFHRASNVGEVRGTGLGLAIVKQAAELHGGSVQLESHLGEGTIVTVTIPI